MTPRVTIAIPFLNEAAFLGAAVRSVLAQTEPSFELLLVDDGSTDGSLSIARSFRDPRIVIVADGQRRRLAARLNEVVRRARASIVARMDADDVMHPRRIAEQLALLAREPSVDAVGSWAAVIDDRSVPLRTLEATSAVNAVVAPSLIHPTMTARKTWLLAHPYDEVIARAEDRELWMRVAGTSRLAAIPEVLYCLRVSPDDERFLRDYRTAQRENRALFLRYGPPTVGRRTTARLWTSSLVKSALVPALVRIGLGRRLLLRRGRPMTQAEERLAREALAASDQRA